MVTYLKPVPMGSVAPRMTPFKGPLSSNSAGRRQMALNAKKQSDVNPFRDSGSGASPSPGSADDSVERLERAVKGRSSEEMRAQANATARKMEIRGVNERSMGEKDDANNPYAPWEEGKLFPEGWEQMSTSEKMNEIYMGRRGMLFWANKAAYASAIGILFTWVVFRFVGPNLGLYKLAGDALPPPV